jgi:hypothetical protein
MEDIRISQEKFNSQGYWFNQIKDAYFFPRPYHVELFDQNGYDLTLLEQVFASFNYEPYYKHRDHRRALKKHWFIQEPKIEGAILNHSLLFERKGYSGKALEQLKKWATKYPIINKIACIRPKWGLDFSMDYVDRQGNAFEALHWEYDGFIYEEILAVKEAIEPILRSIDWDDAGISLLQRKDEWHGLDFFAQSDWKCNYFGVPKERFKMICWS